MRRVEAAETTHEDVVRRDFSLEGGCPLCGGDLDVRVGAGATRAVCKACRWISKPHVRPSEEGVQVLHPAALA